MLSLSILWYSPSKVGAIIGSTSAATNRWGTWLSKTLLCSHLNLRVLTFKLILSIISPSSEMRYCRCIKSGLWSIKAKFGAIAMLWGHYIVIRGCNKSILRIIKVKSTSACSQWTWNSVIYKTDIYGAILAIKSSLSARIELIRELISHWEISLAMIHHFIFETQLWKLHCRHVLSHRWALSASTLSWLHVMIIFENGIKNLIRTIKRTAFLSIVILIENITT